MARNMHENTVVPNRYRSSLHMTHHDTREAGSVPRTRERQSGPDYVTEPRRSSALRQPVWMKGADL